MNQILEKVSKALRLGTNNNNKNEAQNAILAAQRLMAKYHINQEDIDDFLNENESKDTEVIEETADNEMNNDKWKRCLMVVIVKNFRCDVYYRGKKLIIVGSKEDILISKRVYLYAKQAILNSFKIFFKENYNLYAVNNSIRNKYKREYAFGFINGIDEKFKEQKASSELSMVVVNPSVKAYMNNLNFKGYRRNRSSYITDSYCFEEGKKNGRNLADIDTQVEGVG